MIIGIIGIGLIGSSLARAFQNDINHTILVYDISPAHLDVARQLNLADAYYDNAARLTEKCDIVFLCVPVDVIASVARAIAPYLRPGAILTDVGSVKAALTAEINSFLSPHIAFIPGHPIAGTEQSGPQSGQAVLFAGKPYILIDNRAHPRAMQTAAALIATTGAQIVTLDAARHDLILAFTSHLPHLCAFAAMRGATKIAPDALNFAGSSFRDMTRVAASDPAMWRAIFTANAAQIIPVYRQFRAEMDQLISLIETADADALESYIDGARALRLALK